MIAHLLVLRWVSPYPDQSLCPRILEVCDDCTREIEFIRLRCLKVSQYKFKSLPMCRTRISHKLAQCIHSYSKVRTSLHHQLHDASKSTLIGHVLHCVFKLAAAFTHVIVQLSSRGLWCCQGLAVMHTKLGLYRLVKLGLPHYYMTSRTIALRFCTEKVLELFEILHLKFIAKRILVDLRRLTLLLARSNLQHTAPQISFQYYRALHSHSDLIETWQNPS